MNSLLAKLDNEFVGVRTAPFLGIVGLVALYLLLIGPGDYFFVKNVLRRVEAGEVLEVTRRGVPVARLVPLSDDSDLRCIRPATRSIWELDLPWITSGEPSEVTMAAIRDDR